MRVNMSLRPLKTETQSGISSESRHRLLHAGMGLSTESGEFPRLPEKILVLR